MPWFKNKNKKKSVSFIYQGRKYSIPPRGKVEGPEYFAIYKDLEKIDSFVEEQKKENHLKVEKPNPLLNHTGKEKKRSTRRRVILNSNENVTTLTLMNIPNDNSIIKDDTTNLKEVEKAYQFSLDYPKNGLPSVGICILTKDSFDLIKDCVSSILEKVKYPNYKIFIFDTGTKDTKVLDYYSQIKRKPNTPFRVIKVGNYHFSKNYNFGIKKINTDYIFIQNNDTLAINDYISKLMKIAVVDKVGISGPRMLYKNNTIQHDGQHFLSSDGDKFSNPGHVNIGLPVDQIPPELNEVDGITAAGVLVKRDYFLEIGGFDESFKDIYQDVHFCIKNLMNGKKAYCQRKSQMYHFDNTTRKKQWNNPNKVKNMGLDHNNLFRQVAKGDLKLRQKSNKDFSIITLVNNNEHYHKLLDSLKNQKTDSSFEVICLPNYNNEYKSCSEALNVGLDLASSKYQIICHQDIIVPDNWIEGIRKHIMNLESLKNRWGVLGVAGAWGDSNTMGDAAVYVENELSYKLSKVKYGDFAQVQCLDELALITQTSKIRFDETLFDHYHWYGADICLNYISKGYKNYAINVPCLHNSSGNSNLYDEYNKNIFIKQAAILMKKWQRNVKCFRTMTSYFACDTGLITFYLAESMRKEGYKFPTQIKIS